MFRRATVTGLTAPGPEGLLVSPLTGRPCVWFRVRVESWQAHGDLHHRDTICLLRKGNPFAVGETLVHADVIRSDGPPVATVVETVQGKRPPTPDEAPFLHALVTLGHVPALALGRRAHLLDELIWQTTESCLPPGEHLAAEGRLDRHRVLRHSLLTGSRLTSHP